MTLTATISPNGRRRPSRRFRRSISTLALAAGIVNSIIGAEIFRLPADMAAKLGATAPLPICCAR